MNPTGNKTGHWTEYSEAPPGHAVGYFWLRPDGVRFGLRMAGRYYRPGTTHQPVGPAKDIAQLWREGYGGFPAGAYADGAFAADVIGAERENAKLENLPTHLRIMQNEQELELIESIDGTPVSMLIQRPEFLTRPSRHNAWDFVDKRYPLRRLVDAISE